MSLETKNHPADGPTPKWPKVIQYEVFSRYCGPVQLAVLAALEKQPALRSKVQRREPITTSEQSILQELYDEYGDMIRMRSEMID